jgi:hypothetical protein
MNMGETCRMGNVIFRFFNGNTTFIHAPYFLHMISRELKLGGWLNLAPKERQLLISRNQATVREMPLPSSGTSHGGITTLYPIPADQVIIISGVKECRYLIAKVRIIAPYPNRYIRCGRNATNASNSMTLRTIKTRCICLRESSRTIHKHIGIQPTWCSVRRMGCLGTL